jgi:thiol peroxidase
LLSRCIVVLDEQGKVVYTEQVAETTNEPNYAKALQAINN